MIDESERQRFEELERDEAAYKELAAAARALLAKLPRCEFWTGADEVLCGARATFRLIGHEESEYACNEHRFANPGFTVGRIDEVDWSTEAAALKALVGDDDAQ